MHTRTGLAFLAGEAAARQGGDAADRFRSLLQAAFHAQHLDIREPGVVEGLAHEARLDVARFEGDRRNTRLLSEVGRSHRDAVASYGVFGTPTLVFPHGRAAYTKLADAPLETELRTSSSICASWSGSITSCRRSSSPNRKEHDRVDAVYRGRC